MHRIFTKITIAKRVLTNTDFFPTIRWFNVLKSISKPVIYFLCLFGLSGLITLGLTPGALGADSNQSVNQATPSPQPAAPVETREPSQPAETEPEDSRSEIVDQLTESGLLTVNFYQIDIRDILSVLALKREINMVMAQDVSGKVSVHLYNLPLEEALDAITLAGGFNYQKRGDIYYIYKPKEARDPQAERIQLRVFKLKYGAIEKIQDVISALPGIRTVKIHEASNTIIVEDTPENIRKIETLVHYWDTKPKQVLIEVKILEVNLTDDMSMGVNWQQLLGDLTIGTQGFSTPGAGIFADVVAAAGSAHAFAAALDALQTKTRVNTLSTPKILAIHGKPARVQVGGKQGYKVTTVSANLATESIQFIDTGTILDITPYIDDENNVLLSVQPSINSAVIGPTGIPVVQSTTVNTWLMAKNGETVFIGGLISDNKRNSKNIVPCLGDIPVFGLLFGQTRRSIGKSELVVLITPQVLDAELKRSAQEAIGKTRKFEDILKKEPLPAIQQLLEGITPGM